MAARPRVFLLLFCYGFLFWLISFIDRLLPMQGCRDSDLSPEQLVKQIEAAGLYVTAFQEWQPEQKQVPEPPFSVCIIAALRDQPYIMKSMADLLTSFGTSLPPIRICDVHPGGNPQLEPLRQLLPVVSIYDGEPDPPRGKLDERIAKETKDYWRCLNTSLTDATPYVLLLEDDAAVHSELPSLLASVIRQLAARPHIDFVKLYHPEKLRKLPFLPMITASSSLIVLVLHSLLLRSRHFWRLTVLLSLLLSSWLWLHGPRLPSDLRLLLTGGVYLSSIESCCTPAVLFRSESVPVMVRELVDEPSKKGRAKDHILDSSRFVGRLTDMNLVKHIGRVSSLQRNLP